MAQSIYFLWTLVCVVLTINVFRPFKSKDNGILSFFFGFGLGWLIGDLALHWIIFNIGILSLFSLTDIYSSTISQVGIVIHLTCWGALLLRLRALLRLRPVVQQQIKSCLGENYEEQIPIDIRNRFLPPVIDWALYWNPLLLFKNPRIEILRDITFFSDSNIQLKLDIYRPKETTTKCPVLVQIYGGAWVIGTKNQAIPLMANMAAQGWICFAISYRLSPQAVFPDHIIDCKRAVAWIKQHGEEYGADTEFMVVTGGSAGSHLASLMALTPNYPEFQPGFEDIDTSLHGCVANYGLYDFESPFGLKNSYPAFAKLLKIVMRSTPATNPELYRKASPIKWISDKAPPFLVLQGETDALVPLSVAQRFYEALDRNNVPYLCALRLPLLEHAFDILPTISTQLTLSGIERYLAFLWVQHQQSQKNIS